MPHPDAVTNTPPPPIVPGSPHTPQPVPQQPTLPTPRKKLSRGAIVAIIAGGAVAAVLACCGGLAAIGSLADDPAKTGNAAAGDAQPGAAQPGTNPATQATGAATPTKAAPSPPPPAVPADQKFSGRGDKILKLALTPDRFHIATFTHAGSSNFVVITVDSGGEQLDLVNNHIGKYSGTRPLDFREDPAALKIEADGAWTINVQAVQKAPAWTGKSAGRGDAVLLVPSDAPGLNTVKITHKGRSNFVVKAYGDRSDLLVNEIGNYTGETLLPGGTTVIEIEADGAWTLDRA